MRNRDPRFPALHPSTRARAPSRELRRLASVFGAFALALATAGCSVSYPLFGADGDDVKTGSIGRRDAAADGSAQTASGIGRAEKVTSAPLAPPTGATNSAAAAPDPATPSSYAAAPIAPTPPPGLTPVDWGYARGALGLAMGAEASNASVPWANPDSGSYGSFTASAASTSTNGATCRPFTASHSASGQEQRLEGTACRTAAGYWEAVSIRTTASRTL